MTNQDESYRSYALTENMWKVLLKVGIPLAYLYSAFFCFGFSRIIRRQGVNVWVLS